MIFFFLFFLVYYDRNTSKQIYKHNIETNDPPVGGSCSVDPKSGHALNTQFTVSCPKYSDSHSPLMYRFYQERIQKTGIVIKLYLNQMLDPCLIFIFVCFIIYLFFGLNMVVHCCCCLQR